VPVPPNLPEGPRRSARAKKPSATQKAADATAADIAQGEAEGRAWADDELGPAGDKGIGAETRAFLSSVNPDDLWVPRTYKEAMTRPDFWKKPIELECARLRERKVWHLVDRPAGANVVKTMWVFAIKYDADGKVESRKARLVAKGYTQIEGVDFFETYASVVWYESLRMLLATAASKGWEVWGVDFVSAYLNSEMKEDVYMEQPEGMVVEGSELLVAKLDFTLYGTMQGASNWWAELDGAYSELGYERSKADPSIRIRTRGGETTVTGTYTDDVSGISSSPEEAVRAKAELGAKYDARDLGELEKTLGIKIDHDPLTGAISISQRAYAERVLQRFGMQDCNPKRTPISTGTPLIESPTLLSREDAFFMRDKPYLAVLGCIMFLMIATRPDLAYAVNVLSRFSSNPGPTHWHAIMHVLGYLKGTLDYKITYHHGVSIIPVGFFDADYAGCLDTRRSTSGELYAMAGGLVAWGAHREHTVALSTAEAEYMADARGAHQMCWMY
jgi:hypothetical protein